MLEIIVLFSITDGMQCCSEIHKWSWFRRYCLAARVAKSLINRTPLPKSFCVEVTKRINEMVTDGETNIKDHENHDMFKHEHDEQLLQWLNRRPEDWTLSWDGSGAIYGWGHNHRGQLGGLEGAKVKLPMPCESLSALRPIQLAGGEQTLFAVTADGKVYATGKIIDFFYLHFMWKRRLTNGVVLYCRVRSTRSSWYWRCRFSDGTDLIRVNSARVHKESGSQFWRQTLPRLKFRRSCIFMG